MRKRTFLLYCLAFVVSAVIGYVDTNSKTDDNWPMVLILLSGAFLFAVVQPKHAWQWALIIGLGVPLSHLIGRMIGYRPPYPVEPNVIITFIALIPAFVGAYLGVLARILARSFVMQQ